MESAIPSLWTVYLALFCWTRLLTLGPFSDNDVQAGLRCISKLHNLGRALT